MKNRLKKNSSKKTVSPPDSALSLQKHCQTAWDYLEKNPKKKRRWFRQRPRILLLGTEQSGKTHLLRDLQDPVTSAHNTPINPVQPTRQIDWWMNQEAVFIDPPHQDPQQWETLLHALREHQPKRPIHHIVLTIALTDLTHPNPNTLSQLNAQLKAAQTLPTTTPVSIVISKCDQLPGFMETFSDLDKTARQQAFGLSITQDNDHTGLKTGLFNLIHHLNSHLIHRLHQEQNITRRRAIQSFPKALSQLESPLDKLISALNFNETTPLEDIYFTSIQEQMMDTYFIQSMIDHVIQSANQPTKKTLKKKSRRLLALPITATLILTLTILWHMGYQKTMAVIDHIQQSSIRQSSHTPQHMLWLTSLNYLDTIQKAIDNDHLRRYRWLGLPQAHRLSQATQTAYQSLLQNQLAAYTQSTLLTQIQQGMKTNQLALFNALKTYLSASTKKYYQKDIIMNWYLTYWKARYPKDYILQGHLQQHLFSLLSANKPLWTSNPALIKQAQNNLKKLPIADLAFLELQGEYDTTPTSIFPNDHLEGISLKNSTVPAFFSSIHFKTIFNEKIPNIATTLAKGSWVLGNNTGEKITKTQQIAIEKTLRKQYLQYYSQVWNSSLPNIQLATSSDYSAVLQRIALITHPNGNLFQLLKIVKGNATLDTSTHSPALTAINNYLKQSKNYRTIKATLHQLSQWIHSLNNADNTDQKSYEAAIRRLKNHQNDPISRTLTLASTQPQPIKSWLNTLAIDSWKIIMAHTHKHLNTVWQRAVLPIYQNEITHRYPIFSESREDISFNNFSDFFGPNGTMGAFFMNYLQPFVNMSQNYWTLKNLNGVSLNISQTTLNTFIRASIIQQMFFTDHHQSPSFQFIIKGQQLSPSIKHIRITMGGQTYQTYRHQRYPAKKFDWPGPDASFTSVQILTTHNQSTTMTYHGPWSWLRLLQASTLQNAGDPRFFTLIIPVGKNAVNIQLIADHRINPIVPGILNKYRCPDHL